jgi:hypothetical protein
MSDGMNRKRLALVAAAALALLGTRATQAAILLTNTAASQQQQGTATTGLTQPFTFSSFALNGGNAVVALVTYEHTGNTAVSLTATYGGAAMTRFLVNGGAQHAAVFYSINPSVSTGNVVVTGGATSGGSAMAASVIALDNVSATVSPAAIDTDASTTAADDSRTLTYAGTAGGFVVASFIDNAFFSTSPAVNPGAPTYSGNNLDTALLALEADWAGPANAPTSSAGHLHAYGDIAADGNYANTFNASNANSSRVAAATVAFTAVVPEPAAAMALGLGTLPLLARRRPA